MRLARLPGLNVKAVLNFYGPPDLGAWLAQHRGDGAVAVRHVAGATHPGPCESDERSHQFKFSHRERVRAG